MENTNIKSKYASRKLPVNKAAWKLVIPMVFIFLLLSFWSIVGFIFLIRDRQYEKLQKEDFIILQGSIAQSGNENEYLRKTKIKLKWLRFNEFSGTYFIEVNMLDKHQIDNVNRIRMGMNVEIEILRSKLIGTSTLSWLTSRLDKNVVYGLRIENNLIYDYNSIKEKIKKRKNGLNPLIGVVTLPILYSIILIVICYRSLFKNYQLSDEVNLKKPKWYLRKLNAMENKNE